MLPSGRTVEVQGVHATSDPALNVDNAFLSLVPSAEDCAVPLGGPEGSVDQKMRAAIASRLRVRLCASADTQPHGLGDTYRSNRRITACWTCGDGGGRGKSDRRKIVEGGEGRTAAFR